MSDNEEGRNLIAYCGLYCSDCFSHKEKVANLARDLRKDAKNGTSRSPIMEMHI